MECLKDYVGIRGCDVTASSVNHYVNDLPGITTFMVGKIANSEQDSFIDVWNTVQKNTILSFKTTIIAAFKKTKKYKIKTISQLIDFGKIINKGVTSGMEAKWRGFAIQLIFPNNMYSLQSSLQAIWIDSINFYSPIAATGFKVKVFDMDTEETLDTYTMDVAIGWNKKVVGKSYDSFRVFIGYDATLIDSVEMNINPFNQLGCAECTTQIYGGSCTAILRGYESVDLDHPVDGNQGMNIYGLSAVVSIRCLYDWIVCNNKDLFLIAWKYALGMEIMKMRIYTDRMNIYTTIDLDSAKELFNEYSGNLDTELANAIDSVDINKNDCCIECEATFQKPYNFPY